MKITLISNLYEPFARGGAEVIVKRMAQEFVRSGHDVSIITTQPWSQEKTFQPVISKESGVDMYRYAVPNIYFYPKDIEKPFYVRALWHAIDMLNIPSSRACKNILQTIQPDIVITHNLMGMSYFLPRVIKELGIGHVHVLHDIQLAIRSGLMKKGEEQSWMADGLLAHLYQKIVKYLFDSPDIVVSPSNFLKDFYQQKGYFYGSDFTVIRNPIAKRFFSISSKNHSSHKSFTFGCIGQLERHKGIDVLQQAFHQNKAIEAKLEIVGSGSLEEQVRDWARLDERVGYKGKIPNEQLPEWYASIDALVVPTLTYENSPTVIYEALASGIPVIVSDIGGAAELITSQSGIRIPAGDSEQLARAMSMMVDKANSYDQKKIQESIKEFDIESYCKKVLAKIRS